MLRYFLFFCVLLKINSIASQNVTFLRFQLELDTPEITRQKALKNLGETPEKISASLGYLRNLLKDETDLKIPDADDFLIKFLRPMKYDIKKTFERIKTYYKFKVKYGEASNNLTPNSVKDVLEQESVQVLPQRDQFGRRIIVINVNKWDPAKKSAMELFRAIEFVIEFVLLEPMTQINGIVGILNYEDLSFKHVLETTPSFAGMAVSWIQDTAPVQIKAVYVVNNSFLFNVVWTILKPFLSRDITDKFFIEGSNFNRMAKAIGPESLEKKYKGTIPNDVKFGKILFEEAQNYQKFFEQLDKFGYNKN